MTLRPRGSRLQFRQYRADAREHRTEGTRRTAEAHAKSKRGHRTFLQLFASFWRMLRGDRLLIGLALGTVTIATLVKLAPPYATGFVFDYVLGDRAVPEQITRWVGLPDDRAELLTIVAIALVAAAVIAISIGMWGRWLATLTSKRVQSRVRRRVFDHAARLPLHHVHQLKSGGVASVLREDAGGIGELIFSLLYNPWRSIIQLAGTLIILGVIDWRLLVGSLVIIPSVFVTHRTWVARIRPLWRDIRASRQHIDGHATEAFGGMRVVRTYGRQRSEAARFIRNNHLMIRQELMAWWWSRAVDITWSIMIPLASAALLWYGGTRILTDQQRVAEGLITPAQALTVGDLVMFLFYLAMLLEPLATLATSATTFQNNLAGLDRVLDLLAEPHEMAGTSGAVRVRPARVRGAIALRDVHFRYPGTVREVLAGISLEVDAGETVALVGPSGSGKTTLCNLIARFYEPTSGRIELDGADLREIDVESYRRLLGVVEQDIFLFDGSVSENIGYGRRGASMQEIIHAARRAHAHEFVTAFDQGYDTIIGERGVRLSGGQRQRLAIARALLADPRILILDEATSSLDTESERYIQESLRLLMRGRTSFVIAHRLSTITHADRIVVLEHGRIIEQGTHEELMTRSGRYEHMVMLQTAAPGPDPGGDPS